MTVVCEKKFCHEIAAYIGTEGFYRCSNGHIFKPHSIQQHGGTGKAKKKNRRKR